jgi:hypothetical protein
VPVAALQVLCDVSLEWACWLLRFMLADVQHIVAAGVVHSVLIFDAIVRYLRTPGMPMKQRAVALLIMMLKSPQLFAIDKLPDISSIAGVCSLAVQRCETLRADGKLFLPESLLLLVELAVTAASAQRVLNARAQLAKELEAQAAPPVEDGGAMPPATGARS